VDGLIAIRAAFATTVPVCAFRVEFDGVCGSVGEVPQTVTYETGWPPIGTAVTLKAKPPQFAKTEVGKVQVLLATSNVRCCPATRDGAPKLVPLSVLVSTTRQGVIGTYT